MRYFGENRRNEDELTSRERVDLYFKGKSVDRIPCMPFLKDMIKDKENVHRLLEKVTENNIRYIDTVSSMGFSIGICDPVASLSMISKKQFREFVLPYLKVCLDRIKEKGVPGFIHICGKTKGIWNDLVDIGFDTLSIDNCEDVTEAVEMVGDKVCVVGNVDPVDIMRFGTTEDVYKEAMGCINKGINNPNKYILSTGCDIATGAPIENVYALLNAARDFKL